MRRALVPFRQITTNKQECEAVKMPTKWRRRLERAVTPNPYRRVNLHHEAGQWPTCAVGERRHLLELANVAFSSSGRPLSLALEELGMSFNIAVRTHNYGHALSVLDRIDVVTREYMRAALNTEA